MRHSAPNSAKGPRRTSRAAGRIAVLVLAAQATAGLADDVRLTVTEVLATGRLESDAAPAIASELSELPISRLRDRLGYGAYAHEKTTRRTGGWGERMMLGERARLDLRPAAAQEGVQVEASIRARTPEGGLAEPCLTTKLTVPPRFAVPMFCDKLLPDGTVIFFVAAEALAEAE